MARIPQPNQRIDHDHLSGVQKTGFALSMFLIGSFFLALSPILPDVASELSADAAKLGFPGGVYGLTLGAVSVLLAPLHDILSRRLLLGAGAMFHCMGLIVVALSPNWSAFIVGHALCGCGAGIYMPAAYAAVTERTQESERARTLGHVNTGWAAATLLGVPATAILGETLGWRGMMFILSATWVVICMLTLRILVSGRRPQGGRITVSDYWSLKILSSLREARLPWLFLSVILIFVGFYGVYTYLGIGIRNGLGLSAGGAGVFVFFYGFGFLTGGLSGRVIDKLGPERSLCWSAAVLSIILVIIPQSVQSAVLLGVAMYAWGIFQSGALTSFTTIVAKAPLSIRGRALSINTACVFTGASIGTFTMGIVNASQGYATVGVLCLIATATASIIVGWKLVTPLAHVETTQDANGIESR